MDQKQARALGRLQALAALRKDAELARLARVAQSRARLQASLDGLRGFETPLDAGAAGETITDPALVAARLAHARWAEAQRRRLNQQLALVTADYLRLRPEVARAFGRWAVLDRLAAQVDRAGRHGRGSDR